MINLRVAMLFYIMYNDFSGLMKHNYSIILTTVAVKEKGKISCGQHV